MSLKNLTNPVFSYTLAQAALACAAGGSPYEAANTPQGSAPTGGIGLGEL